MTPPDPTPIRSTTKFIATVLAFGWVLATSLDGTWHWFAAVVLQQKGMWP